MRLLSEKWIVQLATAVLLTLFLAYIDEGYYNFNWILNWDNWVAFILYVVIFWGLQVVISKVVNRFAKGTLKTLLSTFTGSILALLFVIFLTVTIL